MGFEKRVSANGLVSKWKMLLLMALFLAVLMNGVYGKRNNPLFKEKSVQIERILKRLNKPAVKSIQSEDGDIIDCVDIYRQPAFDNPLLRNHTIQMRPSSIPQEMKVKKSSSSSAPSSSSILATSQLWHKNGSCPEGTVPIRRIRESDLLRAKTLEDFGKKTPHFVYDPNTIKTDTPEVPKHPVALLLASGFMYWGAKADLNVWNPNVQDADDYSTAQIWLKSGHYSDFETVEAGWAVNPHVYGDKQTRLFVYWTKDGSKTTGCFDLLCSGFVQTSKTISLGAAILGISSHFGQQYHITLYIHKDPDTYNWFVTFGENETIGYWPRDIFNLLLYPATMVQWGGEVYSNKIGSAPHTNTAMGSGEMANYRFGRACFVRNLRVLENSNVLKFPEFVGTHADEFDCYSTFYYTESWLPEPEFYFGGPGGQGFRCH